MLSSEGTRTGGNSLQVSHGLVNVMPGSLSSTLASVITVRDELELGITAGTHSEMVPTVQRGSVPFCGYSCGTQALSLQV